MLCEHVQDLDKFLSLIPANDPQSEQELLIALTKMMVALPSTAPTDLSAEARGEAFLLALDDLPLWATIAAVARWYRGDAGSDSQGKALDCHWCPSPADLRRVAFAEMFVVKQRRDEIERLLKAVPPPFVDDEVRRRVHECLLELAKTLRASPVGRDGSGGEV